MIPTRVAVLGLGEAGFTIHLPALTGMPAIEVVGACDLDHARRERAATRFGVPLFESFDRLLDEARPDVVMVGTPPHRHAEHCLRALAAGAHVVCEKPFVRSVPEADAVIAAAAAAGRGVAVNHQFREMPIFRAVLDEIVKPEAGGLTFAQAWQLVDMPRLHETGWRGEMVQRTLFEAGIHLVDLVLGLFGEVPIGVLASTSAAGGGTGADAVVTVTLEFSGGRLAHILQNRVCKGERQYLEARADTPTASYRASFGGRSRLSAGLYRSTSPHVRFEYGASGIAWKEVGSRRGLIARNPRSPMVAAARSLFARCFAAFGAGSLPPSSAEHARDLTVVIAAAYRSAAIGRRIAIDDAAIRELSSIELG